MVSTVKAIRATAFMPLVIALLPLKCSSRNLKCSHRAPFTKEKMPWCLFEKRSKDEFWFSRKNMRFKGLSVRCFSQFPIILKIHSIFYLIDEDITAVVICCNEAVTFGDIEPLAPARAELAHVRGGRGSGSRVSLLCRHWWCCLLTCIF